MARSTVSLRKQLEFIGGPFDGLTHLLPPETSELVDVALFPLNSRRLRQLFGKEVWPRDDMSKVAIYEQESDEGRVLYRFVGCVSLAETQA
jgi:hypothetical protein